MAGGMGGDGAAGVGGGSEVGYATFGVAVGDGDRRRSLPA